MSWFYWLLLISYISIAISLSVAVATAVGSIWDKPIKGFDEALKLLDEVDEAFDRAMKGK